MEVEEGHETPADNFLDRNKGYDTLRFEFFKAASLWMGRKVRSGVSQLTLSMPEFRSPTVTHKANDASPLFYKEKAKGEAPKNCILQVLGSCIDEQY